MARRFMQGLSHTGQVRSRRGGPGPDTVRALLLRSTRRLAAAGLHFGHGTDNARDEAASLIWHVLRLAPAAGAAAYRGRVNAAQVQAVEALVTRRIRERIPAPYLTQRCWFAGLAMYVDERVLIPRSPLAELIEHRFAPWVQPSAVGAILDLGTGSGCIAIACAKAFRRARVDAVDLSPEALAVARINVRRHGLQRRVRLVESDHFGALGRSRYDIIVSNPPYVGSREYRGLPAEYAHEPRLALASGRDGLDSVRVILRQAATHLTAEGVLIVEVGNSARALQRALPRVPFMWLEFERGGGGVLLLQRRQLVAARL